MLAFINMYRVLNNLDCDLQIVFIHITLMAQNLVRFVGNCLFLALDTNFYPLCVSVIHYQTKFDMLLLLHFTIHYTNSDIYFVIYF